MSGHNLTWACNIVFKKIVMTWLSCFILFSFNLRDWASVFWSKLLVVEDVCERIAMLGWIIKRIFFSCWLFPSTSLKMCKSINVDDTEGRMFVRQTKFYVLEVSNFFLFNISWTIYISIQTRIFVQFPFLVGVRVNSLWKIFL